MSIRILRLALVAAVWWLAYRFGPWRALEIWAAALAVACGGIALLMHRQPPESVTVINRLAGVFLPWGYKVGRGKLLPIVLISWFIWVLIGCAIVLGRTYGGTGWLGGPTSHTGPRSHTVMILLVIAWVIDGGAMLYTIGVILGNGNPGHFFRALSGVLLALIGMIVASVLLVTLSDSVWTSRLALGIAGGPPLIIGGGYALWVLCMLTFGRNARWN